MNFSKPRKPSRKIGSAPTAILLLFWCASTALGGELSRVPDGPRHEFHLMDTQGRQRSLEEFRGQVVLVNFWASWCTPCIQEMPSLLRLQDALQDYPFRVVGINVAEGERRVKTAVKRLGLGFPVVLDTDSVVFRAWDGVVLPTTYILDGNGRVRYVAQGPLDWERIDILDLLKALMPQSADMSSSHRAQ